jgi:hypothetical protein
MQLSFVFNSKEPIPRKSPGLAADDVERLIEADLSLAPEVHSALLVEPVLLEPIELAALLDNLVPLLEASARLGSGAESTQGTEYEPHASTNGRTGGDQKLPAFAWLFPNHAGAGRPARHQQGNHLRARRGTGKKARAAKGQTQGSLFGDRRG